MSLSFEARRKLFHSLGLVFPAFYAVFGRRTSLWVFGVGLLIATIVESVRLHQPSVREFFSRHWGGIQRDKEQFRPSGILWTVMGCFFVTALVPARDIVLAAMLYLTVGDGLAGYVGRTWGRLRIGGKSVEGSLACFLGCWAVGSLVLSPAAGRSEVMWGALLATALEALDPPPDDNLVIPLLSGLGLWFLRGGLS